MVTKKKLKVVDPDTSFFHRKHFVGLVWAVVGGVAASLAFLLLQGEQPPQRVELINPDTIVRTIRAGDSLSLSYMEGMVEELRRLNDAAPLRRMTPDRPDSSGRVLGYPAPAANLPVVNKYKLPEQTKGYTPSSLGVYASHRCPPIEVAAGSDIQTELVLRNQNLVPRLSPLFVSLSRPETAQRSILLLQQQYELLPRSTILLTAPTASGVYRLELGLYVLDELGSEYPSFYRAECRLEVRS